MRRGTLRAEGDDMTTATETTGLAAALAKAQAEMSNPAKNATNGHFRTKYADLAACRDAVLPVLAKHGIALVQMAETTEDGRSVELTTTLLHKAERLSCGTLRLPLAGSNLSHALGSALTYMRRYSLCAVAGVAADDDDDGNNYTGQHQDRRPPQRQQRPPKPQDAPLRAPVFGRLKAQLREAFGESNGRDEAFERADALALDVCSVGIAGVMKDEERAGMLLAELEGGR